MQREGKVWGTTTLLFHRGNFEVHEIFAEKGGYCSQHYHQCKYNTFIVKSGRLKVSVFTKNTYGDLQTMHEDITVLREGEELTIPPGVIHQFEALTDVEALEVYWVELQPTDIKRITQGGKH